MKWTQRCLTVCYIYAYYYDINLEMWIPLAYKYYLFVGSVGIFDGAISQALHTDDTSEGDSGERGCIPIQESTTKVFSKVSKIKLWVWPLSFI